MSDTPDLPAAAVLALPAGVDLDRLVTIHVFGVAPREVRIRGHAGDGSTVTVFDPHRFLSDCVYSRAELESRRLGVPSEYSEDAEDALEVIDHLAARGVYLEVRRRPTGYVAEGTATGGLPDGDDPCGVIPGTEATAVTFAHAVSLASLLCVPHLRPG